MSADVIVDEVRRVRDELVKRYGGLDGWIEHLQEMDRARAGKLQRPTAKESSQRRKEAPKTFGQGTGATGKQREMTLCSEGLRHWRRTETFFTILCMAYWLFKEEPDHYSLEDLFRDKRAVWAGVGNNLALKHLRSVKKGDRVLYYHTGKEKAVVGVMEVVKGPYPDPTRDDTRFVVVDVKPVRRLDRPVSLAEIKSNPIFADFALVRISRLSVMPVTGEQWAQIERLSKQVS